jgi:hypothetical protein
MDAFAVSDTIIRSTEKSDTTAYGYPSWADIYVSSSIAYMGAEWSSSREKWAFNYRFAGTGSADWRSGSDADLIRVAAMDVNLTSNKSAASVWTNSSSEYLGSAPESGTNPDYGAVANGVIGLAITAINHLGASYAWSIIGLISAFVNTTDDEISDPYRAYRNWYWSSDESDVGQFFWFIVDVKPNETVQMSSNYYLIGPGYELLEAGTTYRNIQAGGPGKTSIIMNPETMTAEEKNAYGIETIYRKDFASKVEKLNISERSQQEFLNSDDEVFYYAHNFVEYEVTQVDNLVSEIDVDNLTKESLSDNITYQIERSKKIVLGLRSKNMDKDPENVEMLEKHEERIKLLNDLLIRLSDSSNAKSLNLYDLYMNYKDILS